MKPSSSRRNRFSILFLIGFSFLISCNSEAQKPETNNQSETSTSDNGTAAQEASSTPEDVDVARFESLVSEEGMQILDVRTPGEIAQGYVEGATFINIHDPEFKSKAASMLKKDQPVTIYCKSGGRSAMASSRLQELGFGKIYNYTGGMSEWYRLGKPTTKD